jgi:hypothetical protein
MNIIKIPVEEAKSYWKSSEGKIHPNVIDFGVWEDETSNSESRYVAFEKNNKIYLFGLYESYSDSNTGDSELYYRVWSNTVNELMRNYMPIEHSKEVECVEVKMYNSKVVYNWDLVE